MKKTFKDCVKCEYVSYCDAHITGGAHKHKEGEDPCWISLKDELDRKKKSSKPKKRIVKKCKCKK